MKSFKEFIEELGYTFDRTKLLKEGKSVSFKEFLEANECNLDKCEIVQTMTRKAILLCNPKVDGLETLKGAENNINSWISYLQSAQGGYWKSNECSKQQSLSKESLIELIRKMKEGGEKLDFIFFAYAGHGEYNIDDDYIYPSKNPSDKISKSELIEELKGVAKKGIVILDSCREGLVLEKDHVNDKQLVLEDYKTKNLDENSVILSWEFYTYIAPNEFAVVYSCQKGKSAIELPYKETDTYVGVFSDLLIKAGQLSNGVLKVGEACKKANELMKNYIEWNEYVQQGECNPENSQLPFSLGLK